MVIENELLKKWGCGIDFPYQTALKKLIYQMSARITGMGFYREEIFEKVSYEMGKYEYLTEEYRREEKARNGIRRSGKCIRR